MARRKASSPASGRERSEPLVQGRITAHRDGYGFVVPDAGGEDVFLPQAQMHTAMHGDHVAVWPGLPRSGRRGGGLFHKVLERGQQTVVGRIRAGRGRSRMLVPEDPRLLHDFEALNGHEAEEGDLVIADILRFPENWHPGEARVTRVLGSDGQNLDTDYAIAAFGLPHAWPRPVRRELKALEELDDTLPRKDLTAVPFVTIDGADAKDFDDAVHAEPDGKGWTLRVAIADVSHYVRQGTALDAEARKRGTSVYFPNRVVPMLPPELSEDLCSLRPDVERKALVCELHLGPNAGVRSFRFYPACIRSRARLTYASVEQAVFQRKGAVPKRLKERREELERLAALYRAFHKSRVRRGALDFDSVECRFKFDAEGHVASIHPVTRLEAHRLIEECMIAANVAAARQLQQHRQAGLYRVHDSPDPEKVATLRVLAANFGLEFPNRDPITARDCAELLGSVHGTELQMPMERAVLRTQSLSVYSPDNIGHFGLALERYAHFTSPIRRYPDLAVHRAIRRTLRDRKSAEPSPAEMRELGQHCSMTERRADEAAWDVQAACKCRLAERHVGERRDGVVSAVTQFGVFVELAGLYTEGLLHVSRLGSEYYAYDPETQALRGERTGETWELGRRVRVRIAEVDIKQRKITLLRDA